MSSSQERKSGGSESTPLRSRYSVRPNDPGYDAFVLEHIKAKVIIDPVKGCWLWQGFVQPQKMTRHGFTVGGYGDIGYRGKGQPVHRVMWMLVKGSIPPKMDVCHECDVRRCCNPDHLWLGTRKQNLLDMADKKRGNKASKTECKHGHPLTGENLRLSNGGRRRHCITCEKRNHKQAHYIEWRRNYQRKRRAAKRALREQRV